MSYVKFCLFWATKETKTGNSISSPIGLVLSYVEGFGHFPVQWFGRWGCDPTVPTKTGVFSLTVGGTTAIQWGTGGLLAQ